MGIDRTDDNLNIQLPNVSTVEVVELTQFDGKELTKKILNGQSYDNIVRVLDINTHNSTEKLEFADTRNLSLVRNIKKPILTSIEDLMKSKAKPTVKEDCKINAEEKPEAPNTRVLRSQTKVEQQFTASTKETGAEKKQESSVDKKMYKFVNKLGKDDPKTWQYWFAREPERPSKQKLEIKYAAVDDIFDDESVSILQEADNQTLNQALKTESLIIKSQPKSYKDEDASNWLYNLVTNTTKNAELISNYENGLSILKRTDFIVNLANSINAINTDGLGETQLNIKTTGKRSLEFNGSDHENVDNL